MTMALLLSLQPFLTATIDFPTFSPRLLRLHHFFTAWLFLSRLYVTQYIYRLLGQNLWYIKISFHKLMFNYGLIISVHDC